MSNNTIEFRRLERVEVRLAWSAEASQFTPWLAQLENLWLLGETIGIELELEAQEKSVGPFRADIPCVYLYRMSSSTGFVESRRMLLLK